MTVSEQSAVELGIVAGETSTVRDVPEVAKQPFIRTKPRSKVRHVTRSLLIHPLFSLFSDAVAVILSFYLAFWLRATVPMPVTKGFLPFETLYSLKDYSVVFLALHLLLIVILDLQSFHRHEIMKDVATKLAAVALLGSLIAGGILFVFRIYSYPVSVIGIFSAFSWFLCLAWRYVRRAVVLRGP